MAWQGQGNESDVSVTVEPEFLALQRAQCSMYNDSCCSWCGLWSECCLRFVSAKCLQLLRMDFENEDLSNGITLTTLATHLSLPLIRRGEVI